MELSQRKEFILSTIVEFYISTGQPVGSKLLVTALPFTLSSATIRNEMADLVQMGYLEQPHTSAGRIPTDKGLKYYTEKLLRTYSPSEAEAFRVVSGIDHFEGDDAVILTQACGILAELTGTLAFATLPGSDAAVVTGVQVLPIGKKQAMIIVSTSAGSPVSRISRLTEEADFSLFELFYNAAAANFIGRNREEIGRADLQRITSSLGENALPAAPLLTSFFEALEISRSPRVVLAGESNLMHSSLYADAPEIISLIRDPEAIGETLAGAGEDLSLKIGGENASACMSGATLVTCPYRAGENAAGHIALVGPTKMDYSHILPLVKYVSDVVTRLMSADENEKERTQL
ncbi:MAG: heat-inducible transcription repressor HrcA [Clostridia bacterium]|nr:heat-inducible transcription repressor HrcA [Clostridia bacterium]